MNIRNFFIPENESKDTFYTRFEKEEIRSSSLKDINFVFNKAYNNQIGYYAFIVNETIYRVFLIPKTIAIKDRSHDEILKEFVSYMRELYRIQRKYYKEIKPQIAENSSTILGNESLNDISKIQTVEDLAQFKYGVILDSLYEFFQRHKSHSRALKHFSSQSITGRINLQRNVREPNKTNVHQEKIEDVAYSKLASIAYSAIRLFETTKLPITDTNSGHNVLRGQVQHIKSLLDKKFNLQDTTSTTLEKLLSQKSRKIFGTKHEHLYFQILSLFGLEVLNDDGDQGQIHYYNIKSDSLFFKMNLLYEYAVYEEINNQITNKENITIELQNSEKYKLSYRDQATSKKEVEIESKPDILITDENTKTIYVIDAKWKNLKDKRPGLSDILKLKRDCEKRKNNDYKTIAIFVYPELPYTSSLFQEYLTEDEKPSFSFYLVHIPFLSNMGEDSIRFTLDIFKEPAFISSFQNVDNSIQQFASIKEHLQNIPISEVDENSAVMLQLLYDATNQTIFEALIKKHTLEEILDSSPEIRDVLRGYGHLLEEDNIKFLQTAATTRFYFEKYHLNNTNLDYTLSASGIWKTIEIELNSSIIYLLRYQSRCCPVGEYTKKLPSSKGKISFQTGPNKHQEINITDRKNSPEGYLSNILLGSFKFIFNNIKIKHEANDGGDIYDIFNEFFKSDSYATDKLGEANQLVSYLKEKLESVTVTRNIHVHKDFMNKQKYEVFYNIVFVSKREETNLSLFATLMELDNSITKFIQTSHENSARILNKIL